MPGVTREVSEGPDDLSLVFWMRVRAPNSTCCMQCGLEVLRMPGMWRWGVGWPGHRHACRSGWSPVCAAPLGSSGLVRHLARPAERERDSVPLPGWRAAELGGGRSRVAAMLHGPPRRALLTAPPRTLDTWNRAASLQLRAYSAALNMHTRRRHRLDCHPTCRRVSGGDTTWLGDTAPAPPRPGLARVGP